MFFTNNLSCSILEDKPAEVNLVEIERGVLKEINLYREMLGLCPMTFEWNLDSLATEITKQMIEDKEGINVLLMESSLTDIKNKITLQKHLRKTFAIFFTSDSYANPHDCADIVSFLQASNEENKILSSVEYQYFGIGVNIRLRRKNNTTQKTGRQDFYLYGTIFFSSSIKQTKELSKIKISSDIFDHIVKYNEIFCYQLNKFILGKSFFRGSMIKNAIETNSRLNTIANEELLSSIEEQNDDEEKKKFVAARVIQQAGKQHIVPEVIILHLPRYEAPSRLLFIDEVFSERLKSLLKNKKIREFGMSVVMLEDKTFHLL
ncbi:hypothetical protein CDIK_3731, partial [Cucumispora dikerogammari]